MATLGGNLLQRTRCAYFRGGEPFACNKRKPGSGCAAHRRASTAAMRCSAAATPASPSIRATGRSRSSPSTPRSMCSGPTGQRTIAVEELHREPGATPHIETTLAPDELILRIRVPDDAARPRLDLSQDPRPRILRLRARLGGGRAATWTATPCATARIAIGGVATRPWRARAAEQALVGKPLTPQTARAAGDAALAGAKARPRQRLHDRARRAHRRRRPDDRQAEGLSHERHAISRHAARRRPRQGPRQRRCYARRRRPARACCTPRWRSRRSARAASPASTRKAASAVRGVRLVLTHEDIGDVKSAGLHHGRRLRLPELPADAVDRPSPIAASRSRSSPPTRSKRRSRRRTSSRRAMRAEPFSVTLDAPGAETVNQADTPLQQLLPRDRRRRRRQRLSRRRRSRSTRVFNCPPQHQNPIELIATVAEWQGDTLTIHEGTQNAEAIRHGLATRARHRRRSRSR